MTRLRSLAAGALALAALGAACGSSPESLPPATTPRALKGPSSAIRLVPNQLGKVEFQLLGPTGGPIPNATVSFAIVDNPDTPVQEAQGATLVNAEATTDAQGGAVANVMTGVETTFHLRATSAYADPVEAEILVTTDDKVGSVDIAPFFVAPGGRAARTSAAAIVTVEVRFYNDLECAGLPVRSPPQPTVSMIKVPADGGVAHYKVIDTRVRHAVLARAMRDTTVLAIGCTDVTVPTLVPGGLVQVSVPMFDVGPDPVGRYLVTSELDISPPLAGAQALAATWRDLTDCPLDPAQRWLDCTIDALGPTSDADPLDCVPATAPGGDGALGDALGALRGVPLAGPDGKLTDCRGAKTAAGTVSADALVQGLFGSPLPLPIVRLEAVAEDAALLFDTRALEDTMPNFPRLKSVLEIAPGPTPHEVAVTHRLTHVWFALPGGMTEVALQPLGLPALTVSATGTIDDDDVLSLAGHGFTVRLGTAARSAFGTLVLPRRGLPPDVRKLVAAIAALAHGDDGALSGCAAMDAAVCPRAGRPSGCLVAACSSGLDALATRLEGSFDAVNGTALDLYLAGRARLFDTHGNGVANKLGDLHVPTQEGAWTVDLRPRDGRRAITARWEGNRKEPEADQPQGSQP